MFVFRKYVYSLPSNLFYDLLLEKAIGVEVIEEGEQVTFATYEPIENLKPIRIEEVKVIDPKESFKPILLDDFVICPPWNIPIVINPASSFGTGRHPTTQLSLKLISKYYRKGWSAIDVGCGSGILSIALKKLGCKKLLAIDIDEKAVQECKENAKLNDVKLRCERMSVEGVKDSFDFLVANLEIDTFKKHIKSIEPTFRRIAVFSGLYRKKDLEEFLKLIKGFEILEVQRLKNWYAVTVKK